MKPTQQEIIELAREAGVDRYTKSDYCAGPYWAATDAEIERLVHLALERFGAGGGEPVLFSHPDIFAMKAAHVGVSKPGHELPGYIPLYTHPSPTDLRAEYLRGLEDAKKIASNYGPSRPIVTKTPSQRIVGRWEGEQAASAGIADAIEALKGKQ